MGVFRLLYIFLILGNISYTFNIIETNKYTVIDWERGILSAYTNISVKYPYNANVVFRQNKELLYERIVAGFNLLRVDESRTIKDIASMSSEVSSKIFDWLEANVIYKLPVSYRNRVMLGAYVNVYNRELFKILKDYIYTFRQKSNYLKYMTIDSPVDVDIIIDARHIGLLPVLFGEIYDAKYNLLYKSGYGYNVRYISYDTLNSYKGSNIVIIPAYKGVVKTGEKFANVIVYDDDIPYLLSLNIKSIYIMLK